MFIKCLYFFLYKKLFLFLLLSSKIAITRESARVVPFCGVFWRTLSFGGGSSLRTCQNREEQNNRTSGRDVVGNARVAALRLVPPEEKRSPTPAVEVANERQTQFENKTSIFYALLKIHMSASLKTRIFKFDLVKGFSGFF